MVLVGYCNPSSGCDNQRAPRSEIAGCPRGLQMQTFAEIAHEIESPS
jgi:hypothetical protein